MEINVVTKDDRSKLDKILTNFNDVNFEDKIGLLSDVNENATKKGIYNEFGTAIAPARPFLEPTYLKNENYIIQQIKKYLRAFENPYNFMNVISSTMVDKIKHKIDKMKYPRLAKSTIARKGHNMLLKDTMEMYEAITYRRYRRK